VCLLREGGLPFSKERRKTRIPVNPPRHVRPSPFAAGFSLIELLVVIILVGALTTIGLSSMTKTAASARRTATDQFAAAIEQARTAAITHRKHVILAVAEPRPGDSDLTCRFGLFTTDELPEGGELEAEQLQRWTVLPDGVVFFEGKVSGFRNLLDENGIVLSWKGGENQATVHALAFNPRGGLAWPAGSDPVAVKIGSGTYKDGKPIAAAGGGHSSLRIGRVVARSWMLE
jgi:prepilin-type N-terminal cleavage/methylation domain-containing protein